MLVNYLKPKNRKKREHIKIWNQARLLGQITLGYCHRNHRTNKKKTGHDSPKNEKRIMINEIKEREIEREIKRYRI